MWVVVVAAVVVVVVLVVVDVVVGMGSLSDTSPRRYVRYATDRSPKVTFTSIRDHVGPQLNC